MGSKAESVGERLLTTEIFSVRTDIPSPMVLCVLPEASCGQRCLLRSHKGEPTLPPSMPAASTPYCVLAFHPYPKCGYVRKRKSVRFPPTTV